METEQGEKRMAIETVRELRDFASGLECTRNVSKNQWQAWLDAFAKVSEPSYSHDIQLITLSSSGGGSSRKPGHILLNWRRLFDVGPDVAIASVGIAEDSPFVRGLVALYVWNKIWRGADEPLTDAEASIIETLWLEVGRKRKVDEATAQVLVNSARTSCGLNSLALVDFDRAVLHLSTMKCVELEDGQIWLREWVRRRT